ncbi:metallophosphoesterase [bacterium]|nr:MAG: metallophosphoesterase [bacterium]
MTPKNRVRALVYGSVLLGAVWGVGVEPRLLVEHEETLVLPGWKGPPLRLGLLSDIHAGFNGTSVERIRKVGERLSARRPDAVLLLGDFVVPKGSRFGSLAPEAMAPALKSLRAPLGVYAVLGNHDWWRDGPGVRAALEGVGIKVLENELAELKRPEGSVWLAGLADEWTQDPKPLALLKELAGRGPAVAAVHEPDLFARYPALQVDGFALTVSGHTHGGQVHLPLLGSPLVPSLYRQRYLRGHIVEEGRHLFVTTGLGTSVLPVRFGMRPEFVVLTLRAP